MMALRRAIEVCDGLDALGDALSVSSDRLERMLAGDEAIPHEVFVQVVGLILEAGTSKPGGRSTPDSNEGGRRDRRH